MDTATDTAAQDDSFMSAVDDSDTAGAVETASANSTAAANSTQPSVANWASVVNAVMLTNAVQVHAAFEWAVAVVVYIAVAAVAAYPGQQRLQTVNFATLKDPLEREIVVAAVTAELAR
jgi:hypothetical protein